MGQVAHPPALLRFWLQYIGGPEHILEACIAQADHVVTHSAVRRLPYLIPSNVYMRFALNERSLAVVLFPVEEECHDFLQNFLMITA